MSDGIKRRGFASMTPERRREISIMGGKAVPKEKRTFYTNPFFASKCGQKGGRAVPKEMRSFSTDRVLASKAGRKGGMRDDNSKS